MYPTMLALIHVYKITNIAQNVALFFVPLKDHENVTLFKSLTNGELILYTQQKKESHAFDNSTKKYFLIPDCKVAQGMESTEYTALVATMVTKKTSKMSDDQVH